jgi:hypothetical protein
MRVNDLPAPDLIERMRNLLGGEGSEAGASARLKESQSLKDLLKVELPPLFESLDMTLDHEVDADLKKAVSSVWPLRVPEAAKTKLSPATMLKLEPMQASPLIPYQDVRLVARPFFTLGRSREESDFVTWFWPRNEIHDVKTRRISKKHCAVSVVAEEICLSNIATMGRTIFDGEEVPNSGGVRLGSGGTLDLSGIYFLEVTRFPSVSAAGPKISNLSRFADLPVEEKAAATGSVRFLAVTPHVLPQSATWLLTDATFGASRANAVSLKWDGMAEIQGRLHHYLGTFWLENLVNNGAVQVDGSDLSPGLITPLASGQTVQLGGKQFRVNLER